jgi:hypothetical protein
MAVLCRTIIRYVCLLFHLVSSDLAGGAEEGVDLSVAASME